MQQTKNLPSTLANTTFSPVEGDSYLYTGTVPFALADVISFSVVVVILSELVIKLWNWNNFFYTPKAALEIFSF